LQATDERLLEMTNAGDLHAFEALVERYKKKAYFLALRLVGDSAEAWDISQEAFIRVYRARSRYDGRPFFAWFDTIVAKLAKNYIKRGKVRENYRDTKLAEKVSGEHTSEANPELLMEDDETKRKVWEAIEKLSFEHREIIVLRHFEDKSYEEIAEAVGIPVGSVMSRLYYARKKLRELLENNE